MQCICPCAYTTPQSQAIVAGPQVFVSGQIPANNKGELISGSIADKTTQCCENIVAILKEAGVSIDRVVKVRRTTSSPPQHIPPSIHHHSPLRQGNTTSPLTPDFRSMFSSTTWPTSPR
jgi:enamine deaminase RidA (YjgF/YER057c/UK114 family)